MAAIGAAMGAGGPRPEKSRRVASWVRVLVTADPGALRTLRTWGSSMSRTVRSVSLPTRPISVCRVAEVTLGRTLKGKLQQILRHHGRIREQRTHQVPTGRTHGVATEMPMQVACAASLRR
jgi:hypothetical protein